MSALNRRRYSAGKLFFLQGYVPCFLCLNNSNVMHHLFIQLNHEIPVSIRKIDRSTTTSWYHQDQDLTKKKKQQQQLFNHVRISKKQQPCKGIGGLN